MHSVLQLGALLYVASTLQLCAAETSEAEQILESRRKGPASDSEEDREAWRKGTEPDTRLLWAATHGDPKECTEALNQGADPDTDEPVGPTDFVRELRINFATQSPPRVRSGRYR